MNDNDNETTTTHDALVLMANTATVDGFTNPLTMALLVESWLRAGLEVM